MSAPLLTDVRVVEIPGDRSAAAAGLLSDLGAEVVKIGNAKASYDLKKMFAPDLSPQALAELIRKADIVIGCDPKDFRATGRFGATAQSEGLIAVSITPFGVTGPYADFAGPEIVVSAMGGSLGVTGYEDRPPVKEALDACGFHAEMMAAAGALMALRAREQGGQGQHVDISVQEVAASRMTNGVLAWQFDHRLLERTGVALSYGKARVRCVWDLKDGYVFHSLMTGRFGAPANAALSAWIDEAGFDNPMRGIDWVKYDRSALDPATRAQWETAIAAFFSSLTKAEMREQGRRRGINACVVNEPGDVLADPHLAARDFWTERDGVRLPARFVRAAGAESSDATRSTPFAETHAAAWPERALPAATATAKSALTGVKVLDFSWALVGSITTKLLADHGAEVIKVEIRNPPLPLAH